MDLTPGAAGFICSNQPPMLVACMMAPLKILAEAGGVRATRRKSLLLTGYLELLLQQRGLAPASAVADGARGVEIVTPADPAARGCQLSLRIISKRPAAEAPLTMKVLGQMLDERGATVDEREPDIVRVAPAPIYNSFRDVQRFVDLLAECLKAE
mgnify:CR=1 FL=1|jgi:kynureninase|tara:strand:+ start:444 stop:908 length:465 start_codon:yes stop_codon:yes gene_type:complete